MIVFEDTNPKSVIEVKQFLGMNLNRDGTQLDPGESPDMLNVSVDNDGTLDKRFGYEVLAKLDDPIYGVFEYKDQALVISGNKIYKTKDFEIYSEIYAGLSRAPAKGFFYGDKFYILNGYDYVYYDGSVVKDVEPYVPLMTISSPPTGGGTPFEDWNLLGDAFRQTFNTDGTSKTFQLVMGGLSNKPVTAKHLISGLEYGEGSGLSVNRLTGVVTFTIAPAKMGDGVNELEIKAHAPMGEYQTAIIGCTQYHIYGGSNDTRIHFFGNPDFPSRIFRSGLLDPSYWPENSFNEPGTSATAVTGRASHYDTAIIFKEGSIHSETFTIGSDGIGSFPTKTINSRVGCVAADSVQVLENDPIFLSKDGVYVLMASNVKDERNVKLVSDKITGDLLASDLPKAKSVVYKDRYLLFFPDGVVWVYQQRINAWYKWDSIRALSLNVIRDRLYFGRDDGSVCIIKTAESHKPFNDDDGFFFLGADMGTIREDDSGGLEWQNFGNGDATVKSKLNYYPVITSLTMTTSEKTNTQEIDFALTDSVEEHEFTAGGIMNYEAADGPVDIRVGFEFRHPSGKTIAVNDIVLEGIEIELPEDAAEAQVRIMIEAGYVKERATFFLSGMFPAAFGIPKLVLRQMKVLTRYKVQRPIRARWVSKIFEISPLIFSKLHNMTCVLRPGSTVSADVEYRTDRDSSWRVPSRSGRNIFIASLYDYRRVDYSTFSYMGNNIPQTFNKKLHTKRVSYVQLKFENDRANDSMGLLSLILTYSAQKER